MDFGCGWGRVGRLFMNSIAPSNIIGVEPHSERVGDGPGPQPHGLFHAESAPATAALARLQRRLDLVSFSVFSHLDEMFSNAWIYEFARIIKPGGIAFLTTHAGLSLTTVKKLVRRSPRAGNKMLADAAWLARLAIKRSF